MGGTFDPIHNGHLAIANTVYTKFKQVITFMPTAIPNYKAAPDATNVQRLKMLELAITNKPHYKIDTLEINKNSYSCSYSTLTFLRNKIGHNVPIYYIIGQDSLISLDTWDSWQDLFNLTNFIVLNRPDYSYAMMTTKLQTIFKERKTTNCDNLNVPYGKIYMLDFILSNISSTKIRDCVKNNIPIDDYVPPLVAKYILQNNIYKE